MPHSKRVEGACTAGYCSASDCAAETLSPFGSSSNVEVNPAKRGEEERKVKDALEGRNGKNEDGRDGIEAVARFVSSSFATTRWASAD